MLSTEQQTAFEALNLAGVMDGWWRGDGRLGFIFTAKIVKTTPTTGEHTIPNSRIIDPGSTKVGIFGMIGAKMMRPVPPVFTWRLASHDGEYTPGNSSSVFATLGSSNILDYDLKLTLEERVTPNPWTQPTINDKPPLFEDQLQLVGWECVDTDIVLTAREPSIEYGKTKFTKDNHRNEFTWGSTGVEQTFTR